MNNSLKTLRKTAGFTCKQLAELSGVGASTINNFENGATEASDETLSRIAKTLKVSVDQIRAIPTDSSGVVPLETAISTPEKEQKQKELLENVQRSYEALPDNILPAFPDDFIWQMMIQYAKAIDAQEGEARRSSLIQIGRHAAELLRRGKLEIKGP